MPLGLLRIATASPPVKVADVAFNLHATQSALRQAHESGASVIVFPELGLTGYTCGDLFAQESLLQAASDAVVSLVEETRPVSILAAVGFPFVVAGRLYNCAAVLANGEVKGIIPKQYVPNSGEYYERRWFTPALGLESRLIDFRGREVLFGHAQAFSDDQIGAVIGIELCEDLWAVQPPSGSLCLAGVNLMLNLSASNEILGKATYRRALVQQQSARALCAYAYASAGPGESSTDLVFSGHCLIAENGILLAESQRFQSEGTLTLADIDLQRLEHERRTNTSFSAVPAPTVHRVPIRLNAPETQAPLLRPNPTHPFVPSDPAQRDTACREIFSIQTAGLGKRLSQTGIQRIVLGVSGGLDSTLALLVAVAAFDRLRLSRSEIIAVTMPGFGTTSRTEGNAKRLAQALGVSLRRIEIAEAVTRHFADIDHPSGLHDVTYENAQARERTQILMDLANQQMALVVGTGDLSEAALGWCTFNGDHMSMYHVNAGVPKTLVKYLVQWCAETEFSGAPGEVLSDVIATPISPELLPLSESGEQPQTTEASVGPYELHDFFLFHVVRFGCGPDKVLLLAEQAFGANYSREIVIHWLRVFYQRFFSQQFKRSAMPDGPKVGSLALSPRGDWRMPSDAEVRLWLAELQSLSSIQSGE